MRLRTCLLAVLIPALFLSGCILPIQHVSPDPVIHGDGFQDSPDVAVYSFPDTDTVLVSQAPERSSAGVFSGISEPKLAVLWYAMADAHVFDLREEFSPALATSGIPYREYDAENDRHRQLDQVREAVAGGRNILAVQLVSSNAESAAEILDAAGGCPVLFFDRTPDPEQFSSVISERETAACMICTDPAEAGKVQGRMIGEYLVAHFSAADLNQDGKIRYTFLAGDAEDSTALTLTHSALDAANSILAENGYRTLSYLDEENPMGFQADPNGAWSSDAGHSIIFSDLNDYNYANSNMIELIAANNDDMALGALTALQAAWCNLGDGNVVTIPLFGIGASSAARSAVSLGQMTGTVDFNAAGYAKAVLATVRGLTDGRAPEGVFSELSASSAEFTCMSASPNVLSISPQAVLASSS